MEKTSLLLLVVSLNAALGGQLYHDIKELSSRNDSSCSQADMETSECLDSEGNILGLSHRGIIPIGATCRLTLSETEIGDFVCLSNGILFEKSANIEMGIRNKRDAQGNWNLAFNGINAVSSVANLVLGIIGLATHKDPNQPPILTCGAPKKSQPIVADKGKDTAVVEWTGASAEDHDDDDEATVKQIPESYKSGQEFSEGQYAVTFMALDKNGGAAACQMNFEVRVIHCPSPRWPRNGAYHCTQPGYKYGSSCSVQCLDGYKEKGGGSTTIKCDRSGLSGYWTNGNVPDCVPIKCLQLPTIPNGRIDCPNNKAEFDTTCAIVCDDGYKRTGSYFISCDKRGKWETPVAHCEDITPPEFDMTTCPKTILFSTDSPNNTAFVSWDIPAGSDNSRLPVNITEIHGYTPGRRYQAGTYHLRYTITDQNGNVGHACSFTIKVQTINCKPPDLQTEGASHMVYDCPSSYRYGANCSLSCKSGYPLGGANYIQCVKQDEYSDPPTLIWKEPQHQLKPFCKESTCKDLRAPKNGATACDLWIHGRMCQIQCDEKYDFAYSFPDLYVCGTNTGQWKPYDLVPDCTRTVNANQIHMKSSIFYYSDKCNSSKANIQQIQSNFIKALNSSQFSSVCVGEPFCSAEFVNVTCGPTARRRREVAFYERLRRSAHRYAYKVTFDVSVPISSNTSQSKSMVFAMKANLLTQMTMVIDQEIRSGHFDLPVAGLQIESDSFNQGLIEYKCPKGLRAKMASESCTGCPVGMYMAEDVGKCLPCPVGTYQDAINSIECKPCPLDTSTITTGSINNSQCIGMCDPGSFANSGLQPCAECPVTDYQPLKGQNKCIPCKAQTRSLGTGATSSSECQGYDVAIGKGAPIMLQKYLSAKSSLTGTPLTYASWIYMRASNGTERLFKLQSADNSSSIECTYKHALSFEVSGRTIATNITLKRRQWTHLAVAINDDVTIYKRGQVVLKQNVGPLKPAFDFRNVTLSIESGDSDISLGSYCRNLVKTNIFIDEDSITCSMGDTNDLVDPFNVSRIISDVLAYASLEQTFKIPDISFSRPFSISVGSGSYALGA